MARAIAFAVNFFSASSLTKKAYLNSVAAGVEYCARFAVAFLVTPFLISGLGDALYGVWVVILKMTDYLSAGGRSSQALKWFVVNRQESQDLAEKRQGVGGAVAAWIVFLPLQLTIGGVVAWYLPVWMSISPEQFSIVRAAALLVIASLILRGCVDIPLSVLVGENLGYKRIWIAAPLVVLGGGMTILALRLHWGLLGVAGAMLATVVLTGLTFFAVVKGNVPWFGFAVPNQATVRQFIGWSWWFTLWGLVARVMMASDAVVLGIATSPELVATYAVVRFLPDGVLRFLTTLVFETVPGIGKVFASGDLERAAKMRGEVMLLTWLATTSVGATILLWNHSFVTLWVGAEYAVGPLSTLLIVVMIFQIAWIRADADFIDLTLNLKRKVTLGVVSTVLALGFAVLLIRWLENGIVGLCLGFIIGRTILSISYPIILMAVFEVPFRSQLIGCARPAIVTAFLFGLMAWFGAEVNAQSWPSLALFALATAVVTAVVAFGLGLTTDRQANVLRRLRQIVGRVHA